VLKELLGECQTFIAGGGVKIYCSEGSQAMYGQLTFLVSEEGKVMGSEIYGYVAEEIRWTVWMNFVFGGLHSDGSFSLRERHAVPRAYQAKLM
jgi:hypothetical protein